MASGGIAGDDASPAVDHCANATHVALGGTVNGTTCSGTTVGESPCQEGQNPVVFVYVDAAVGSSLQLSSALAGVSLLGFSTCASDETSECVFGGGPSPAVYHPSSSGMRLFGITHVDTTCGDFTITVTAQ